MMMSDVEQTISAVQSAVKGTSSLLLLPSNSNSPATSLRVSSLTIINL
jgi:hypothetical protein